MGRQPCPCNQARPVLAHREAGGAVAGPEREQSVSPFRGNTRTVTARRLPCPASSASRRFGSSCIRAITHPILRRPKGRGPVARGASAVGRKGESRRIPGVPWGGGMSRKGGQPGLEVEGLLHFLCIFPSRWAILKSAEHFTDGAREGGTGGESV